MRSLRALLLTASLAAASTSSTAQQNGPLPGPNPLFPPDNWWNVDISAAPVDPGSAAFVTFYGGGTTFHPDFGGNNPDDPPVGIYGMPYASVTQLQPRVPVFWTASGDES